MNINIRWSDNTKELAAHLREGTGQIEATRASVEKMVNSLSGDKLITAAHKYTAAVEQMGGVEKLNANEKERINALVTKAIEKYELLGKTAPEAMLKLRDATSAASSSWGDFVHNFNVEQAISDPMGTAKNAVLAFADTLGPAKIAMLAAATSALAVATALFKLTESAAAVGGKLNDLSEKTGLSVPALSRLSNAAQVAGSDIDTLANAVFMFEKRLGEGSPEFGKGLDRLKLSVEEVKATNPDKLLELIAERLKAIEDPADRAAAVVEVFGRQGQNLIPILNKLGAALKETADITPWTAEQAADAEKFEMQLESLKVHAEALGLSIGRELIPYVSEFVSVGVEVASFVGPLVGKLSGLTGMLHTLGDAWTSAAAAIRMFRGQAEKIPDISGDAAAGVKAWKKEVADMGKIHVPTLTEALETEREASKKLDLQHKTLTATEKSHSDVIQAATLSYKKYVEAAFPLVGLAPDLSRHMEEMSQRFQDVRESMENLISAQLELNRVEASTGAIIGGTVIPAFSKLPNVIAQNKDQIDKARDSTDDAKDATVSWKDALHDLSQSLTQLAQVSGDSFGGIIKEIAEFAVAWNLAATAVENYKKSNQGLAATTTFLASGAVAVASATSSGSTGSRAAKGAISGAQVGSAFGPWGTVIGAGVGALVGWLRGQAEEKKINRIREAFVQASGGLAALNEQAHKAGMTLDHLLDAKNAEAYTAAINELNDAFQFQDDAMAKAQQTIEKYGFSIEELGPAWARQQLDKQAQGLFEDYQVLIAAGIPLENVLKKMAPDINSFVQQAKKSGTEIPAAMKPILQKMIEHGELLDENGKAYQSLEDTGLTFSETMTEGFKKLISSVERLTQAIARGLGIALDSLPSNVDTEVDVHWKVDQPPTWREGDQMPADWLPIPGSRPTPVPIGTVGSNPLGVSSAQSFTASSSTQSVVVNLGGVTVQAPDGTALDDMEAFAPAFREGLRLDTGFMRSTLEGLVAKKVEDLTNAG